MASFDVNSGCTVLKLDRTHVRLLKQDVGMSKKEQYKHLIHWLPLECVV